MKAASLLLDEYRSRRAKPLEASRLLFTGVGDQDVYNISGLFTGGDGRVCLAGRVEARDSERSIVVVFTENDAGQWEPLPGSPPLELQDPFVFSHAGKRYLGGVEVILAGPEDGGSSRWRTVVYDHSDLAEPELAFVGPWGMKDLRFVDLADGRLGVLTRPQGGADGPGRIGFTIAASLAQLGPADIDQAPRLLDLFVPGEWGGVNHAWLLPDGRISLLGHIACFDDAGCRHYYPMSLELDPATLKHSEPRILFERSDLPDGPVKHPDLTDVIFPGWVDLSGAAPVVYCGVSDVEAFRVVLPENPWGHHAERVDLNQVFKSYDIRGIYPDQLDAELARRVGAAFVRVTGAAETEGGLGAIVVGRDMRPSGPELLDAFCEGAIGQGVDVYDFGLASTDELYFATGTLNLPGAMFTASHNPAEYNGIKLCRSGAVPVGLDTGLRQMKHLAAEPIPDAATTPGQVLRKDLLSDYAAHLLALAPLDGIRPLKVVVDAGNGMAGHTVPAVLTRPELTITPMYFELDGRFPHHEANPMDPANLVDLQERVRAEGADLGLAFDGDADRCFIVDERGEALSPSVITAMIAEQELAKHPGAVVIHNLITSRAVPELITRLGGRPWRTRVGHSFIKAEMVEQNAVFGGEHSGHYYFRDFWRADSGMLAALRVLSALGRTPEGTRLSDMVAGYSTYADSGELNYQVEDPEAAIARVRTAYQDQPGVSFDHLDGMTVDGPDWWFNLRPSGTEPLLRLNVEALDADRVTEIRDRVRTIIGVHAGSGSSPRPPSR